MTTPNTTITDRLRDGLQALQLETVNLGHRITAATTEIATVKTALEDDLDEVNKKLDKIESARSKLTWVVITLVVGAAVKFILDGKLGGISI